jgi:hypothetical protein
MNKRLSTINRPACNIRILLTLCNCPKIYEGPEEISVAASLLSDQRILVS